MLSFISIIPTGAYRVGRKEKELNHEKVKIITGSKYYVFEIQLP